MNQPKAFNVPGAILWLAGIFAGVHLVRAMLPVRTDIDTLLYFAFIPARYLATDAPGGLGAKIWTFLTYGFLHGDIAHLLLNCVWMLAFGSVLARRFGATRFFTFSAVCAIAGALLHLVVRWGDLVPVVGASAAISGQMAGALRFIFLPQTHHGRFGIPGDETRSLRPATLAEMLTNRRALIFLGIWAAINLMAGFGALDAAGTGAQIAWEAHIGGFLAGLFLFSLFDRPARPDPAPPRRPPFYTIDGGRD